MNSNNPNTNAPELRKPWLTPWPSDELQHVDECPICGARERNMLHDDLIDSVFFVSPGYWTLYQCVQCRSAYLSPRPNVVSIVKAYESYYTHNHAGFETRFEELGSLRKLRRKLANGYRNRRFGSSATPSLSVGAALIWALTPVRRQLDRGHRHLPRPSAGQHTLLDFGCGNGAFLKQAESCGWQAFGVDPDPEAVATARLGNLNVECGGIDSVEALGLEFDAITMNHVVEHLHDPVDVLRRCHALLRPNGMLWMEFPRIDSQGHRRFGKHWRGLECPRHLVLPSAKAIVQALSSIGFSEIRELERPSVVRFIFAASRAMAAGRSPYVHAKTSFQEWAIDTFAIVLEGLGFCSREFITLSCRKGASFGEAPQIG